MNILNLNIDHILSFITILVRTLMVITLLPLFGEAFIPSIVKVAFAFVISVVLYPVVKIDASLFPQTIPGFLTAMVPEFLFALSVGLSARLIFAGIQLGGQLAGMQIGFGYANVVSPTESNQISIFAQFEYLMAILVFFVFNIHYFFFKALALSFEIMPPFQQFENIQNLTVFINQRALAMYILSIKIGAPIIAGILLTDTLLALISKAVPQLNVFIEGFPIKILIGLSLAVFSLSFILAVMKNSFFEMDNILLSLLSIFRPTS